LSIFIVLNLEYAERLWVVLIFAMVLPFSLWLVYFCLQECGEFAIGSLLLRLLSQHHTV
jgi:hypothetical protein